MLRFPRTRSLVTTLVLGVRGGYGVLGDEEEKTVLISDDIFTPEGTRSSDHPEHPTLRGPDDRVAYIEPALHTTSVSFSEDLDYGTTTYQIPSGRSETYQEPQRCPSPGSPARRGTWRSPERPSGPQQP